eukprot:gene270-179_t
MSSSQQIEQHIDVITGPSYDNELLSTTLTEEEIRLMNAYWRAANYLSVGQIYLLSNPLLKTPLKAEEVKPRLLGHWGTTPGLNFIYVHLNRVIKQRNLDMLYIAGPGHGGPALVANVWLEGTYSEYYPDTDGAVLPILHLNGYKIANPTVLARISSRELEYLMIGYGYQPFFVEGSDPVEMHRKFAATLDRCLDIIREIQRKAREENDQTRPLWPMIIFRSPKGWTGPKEVDGKKTENYFRSHQVPFGEVREVPSHLALLEEWMRSYHPEELFTADGSLIPELRALAPSGKKRMGDSPYANGGLVRDLHLPNFRDYAFNVQVPGGLTAESPRPMARFLRDALKLNATTKNFRIFGPDETNSNRLGDVFDYTNRVWMADRIAEDDHLDTSGRVMEILSEHTCQGWLEGYLLTGRHGFFSCYEAFIHLIDSMFNQHAKWLKVTRSHITWRRPIASLNYFLTSHVWRQDHNGFSHQDPGFIDHVVNKKAEIIRVYLPPDGNTLLSVADHCLRSHNLVNVIVAGKQPEYQWLDMDAAMKHCAKGLGIWEWASSDPVIFAYHGYPSLVHRLVYRRKNHPNFHVRGYKEEGTTTTPFDMVVINGLDRYHLVQDVIERVPRLQQRCAYLKQQMQDKLLEHKEYIQRVGDDMPEVKNWRWPAEKYTSTA